MDIKEQERRATREVWLFAIIGFSIIIGGILLSMLVGDNIGNWIVERPTIYCPLIWAVFALLTATFEALFFTHEINSAFKEKINEHPLFVAIRACVFMPLWFLTSWKIAIVMFIMFPFLHDGQYYRFRNKLVPDTYKKRWFDQSTTSTAISTKYMTPVVRTILFVLSIIGLILINIFVW